MQVDLSPDDLFVLTGALRQFQRNASPRFAAELGELLARMQTAYEDARKQSAIEEMNALKASIKR